MQSGFGVLFFVVAAFICVGGIGWLVTVFNSLIQVKNNTDKAWMNIEVLLLQRNEELYKLIEILKAGMQYEQDLLQSLVTLRTSYGNARGTVAKTNIENKIRGRMAQLRAIGERYPEIKPTALYENVMERISRLEAGIADRHVFFNETVNIFNTRIEQFPEVIVARLLGYRQHPYLKPQSGDKGA